MKAKVFAIKAAAVGGEVTVDPAWNLVGTAGPIMVASDRPNVLTPGNPNAAPGIILVLEQTVEVETPVDERD